MAADIQGARTSRRNEEMRPISIERGVAPYAEGSCVISYGATRVLCAASVEEGVPGWRRGRGEGWMTAEYAMLPRATRTRTSRERSQLGGRTQEIQRLIGRSIRAMLDDFRFGEYTVKLDCDVLVADGGTRTASITGAYVALQVALKKLIASGTVPAGAVQSAVAAISVGIVKGVPMLDLCYEEDSTAEVDFNVVMTGADEFVEVQGTAEHKPFSRSGMDNLLDLARDGILELFEKQREAIAEG